MALNQKVFNETLLKTVDRWQLSTLKIILPLFHVTLDYRKFKSFFQRRAERGFPIWNEPA